MNKQTVPNLVAGTKTTYMLKTDSEIAYERVYDAPRDRVFEAFTDPKRVTAWWGPPSTPTRVEAMEVRNGGKWHFAQKDASGRPHVFFGTYREVDSPRKIVSTFQYEGAPHVIQETYEFIEQGDKTLLRATCVFPSGAALGGMMQAGMDSAGGWPEGLRHQWRMERFAALVRS